MSTPTETIRGVMLCNPNVTWSSNLSPAITLEGVTYTKRFYPNTISYGPPSSVTECNSTYVSAGNSGPLGWTEGFRDVNQLSGPIQFPVLGFQYSIVDGRFIVPPSNVTQNNNDPDGFAQLRQYVFMKIDQNMQGVYKVRITQFDLTTGEAKGAFYGQHFVYIGSGVRYVALPSAQFIPKDNVRLVMDVIYSPVPGYLGALPSFISTFVTDTRADTFASISYPIANLSDIYDASSIVGVGDRSFYLAVSLLGNAENSTLILKAKKINWINRIAATLRGIPQLPLPESEVYSI